MKIQFNIDTENKADCELILRQALVLYRQHEPSRSDIESKIRKIVSEYFKGGER